MNNEEFFQQFKAMFNDPFQRLELVDYFDKLVQECTANPKPMRVAFIGTYDDFMEAMGHGGDLVDGVCEVTINSLTIIHCLSGEDVYGKSFDAFVLYSRNHSQSLFEASFYLSGHNVPKLTKDDFLKMKAEYKVGDGKDHISFKIASHA